MTALIAAAGTGEALALRYGKEMMVQIRFRCWQGLNIQLLGRGRPWPYESA
jgi:hypothetical protein